MNIFALDNCPIRAARDQCDKHVVKMILETAQMLSTVAQQHNHTVDGIYKPTHRNHPCTIWAGQSQDNYDWLCTHGLALADEYTARYGKRHKSTDLIERLTELVFLPIIGQTPFAQAMPGQYRDTDPVVAYRQYYKAEKSAIAVWAHSDEPTWW